MKLRNPASKLQVPQSHLPEVLIIWAFQSPGMIRGFLPFILEAHRLPLARYRCMSAHKGRPEACSRPPVRRLV